MLFLIFRHRSTMEVDIFAQPNAPPPPPPPPPPPRSLTIKKLPTTLYYNNAFTVKDSFSFEDKFLMQDSNLDMASLDGVSLFITISFDEILIFA